MARRRYTEYRKVLEELGLEQIDVYRYRDRDVLRVRERGGRVLVIELPRRRDEMSIEEFRKVVSSALR
ncbi:MAG: hypothetical protein DSY37_02320 [Hyperthermus sp.]|nr:MAG: hypothetical protein DSY37_02320 [Hyperthermus sp.]